MPSDWWAGGRDGHPGLRQPLNAPCVDLDDRRSLDVGETEFKASVGASLTLGCTVPRQLRHCGPRG
ncbi:MAG: hypothetical protein CM15mP128_2260 [Methanobacteriota archaeon]|nr:MAG: hypothetical protein CM15mP128_2260 [Euryarchaeota archaeon]